MLIFTILHTLQLKMIVKIFTVQNPLYLIIRKVDGHIVCNSVECNSAKCNSIEEQDRSKYLLFDSTDENKEVLKKVHRTLGWD